MKWLFSILLIANLGMFIWLFPQQNGAASQPAPADVGRLRLVGEPEVELPGVDAGDLAQNQPLAGDSVTDRTDPMETAEPAESPQLPPLEQEQEPTAVDIAATAESPEAQPAPAKPFCASVGAFGKRSEAELLSVHLLAQGVKTEITSESSNEQAGYWVLIPPQPDRAAAVQIAKDLEAAGISDLWRFTSGGLAHAISLGLFRDEERAQVRRDQIADMGFAPEVRPRYREQTRYWLNYRYTGDNPLTETYWQELSGEMPELERSQSPCP